MGVPSYCVLLCYFCAQAYLDTLMKCRLSFTFNIYLHLPTFYYLHLQQSHLHAFIKLHFQHLPSPSTFYTFTFSSEPRLHAFRAPFHRNYLFSRCLIVENLGKFPA
eukprot:3669676-Pleurochrysis_carterae.AAC.1